MGEPAVLARVVRSGLEESIHLGHVAVCDASGALLAWAGDPGRVLFARSSMKPLQAAVSLSYVEDELTDDEVAIMCGSHNGEPIHVRTVLRLLERAGLGPDALRCPPAWPLSLAEARAHDGPRRELHNCSGKHAGMLLACVRGSLPVESYLAAGHPLQRRVLETIVSTIGVGPSAIGVDGCGVPVHALPLRAMATLFARLVTTESFARVSAAMRASPYLVAGSERLDTALMERVDTVVAKGGAEGLACVGVADGGIGIAVRVDDGSQRAVAPAVLRALEILEVVGNEQLDALAPFARPPVLGGGAPVGALTSDFTLERT